MGICDLDIVLLASTILSLSSSVYLVSHSSLILQISFISHSHDLLLKKIAHLNTRPLTTSNFRRLKSCWINWYPVDPSQLVPTSPYFPSFPRKEIITIASKKTVRFWSITHWSHSM